MTRSLPTTKQRILFVDDDLSILAGLQNLLYKDRRRWDMTFAASGELALEKVYAQPFDVVVCDMRMPGMDGATVLNRVKDASPSTARIMLSGHAEREAIVRALPALHQLLAKPCDATTLRSTIERSLESEAAMRDSKVRGVIGKIDKLPSAPAVYAALSAAMSTSATTLDELAAIVARDPGLSAKVLQLVNSAYFGSGQKTSSITEAVALLGTEQLRYIGITAPVFTALPEDPCAGFGLAARQEAAAKIARRVREAVPSDVAEQAYSGALLHDVGSVVLAVGFPGEYERVLAAGDPDIIGLENATFGTNHAEVGACLLGLWGLPGPIVDIVRYHHRWEEAPPESRAVVRAVNAAHEEAV